MQNVVTAAFRKTLLKCIPVIWTIPGSSRRASLQSSSLPESVKNQHLKCLQAQRKVEGIICCEVIISTFRAFAWERCVKSCYYVSGLFQSEPFPVVLCRSVDKGCTFTDMDSIVLGDASILPARNVQSLLSISYFSVCTALISLWKFHAQVPVPGHALIESLSTCLKVVNSI